MLNINIKSPLGALLGNYTVIARNRRKTGKKKAIISNHLITKRPFLCV